MATATTVSSSSPASASSSTGKGAGRQLNAQGNFIAGSISGLLSTCITNPFDTLRTRMGASRAATGVSSKNLTAHIKSLFEGGLVSGLGVGLKMNLISSVPSNAVYLTGYKFFNKEVREVLGDRPVMVPFFSAMFAVMTTNGLLSPFFTIRTRVMLEKEATIGGIAKSILANEGPRGFYRGALANTSGRIVEEATFWMLYESAMAWNSTHDSGSLKSGEWFWRSFLILGTSAWCKIIGSTISYPYNVVMTHLREVDAKTGKHNHNHIGPTIKFIYANDGMMGFWKGLTPHLIRCALSKSTQIYFFEVGAFCVGATGAFNLK
jgi:solute carrier family 25 protein 33/36